MKCYPIHIDILIVFVVCGLFFPLAPSTTMAGEKPAAKTKDVLTAEMKAGNAFTSAQGGYGITAPEGWQKSDTPMPPIDVTFFSKTDGGVNISVTFAPAEGQKEIAESTATEMKDMFKMNYPGYTVTAEEWRMLDGVKAYGLSSRYNRLGSELQNKQVMLVKGDRFYTITYTSTPQLFMKYLGDFEKAVESFKITGENKPPVVESNKIGR